MPSCIRASLHIDIYGLMTGNYSMRMEKTGVHHRKQL